MAVSLASGSLFLSVQASVFAALLLIYKEFAPTVRREGKEGESPAPH